MKRVLAVYKVNSRYAIGVAICFTVQMAFFPGVMLGFQWPFIPNFSWFVITVVTYASFGDTMGRTAAKHFDFLSKETFLMTCSIRGVLFTTVYLLAFYKVATVVFGSTWFMIISLGIFAASCGYWTTIGMKYGSGRETGDMALAGSIMGFHITLGISLGSTLALIFFS